MNISILGCGWLGLPLADHLIKRNHNIKGSTTTKNKIKELREHAITPYLLKLIPQLSGSEQVTDFWKSNVLVLNIPPGRNRNSVVDYHMQQVKEVINQLKTGAVDHVIYISSTSVYPSAPGVVHEDDAQPGRAGRASGNALLEAETLLLNSDDFNTTVLRFGGLYGDDRHPARYMAGRTNLDRGEAPVNLIHRDDCIAIITQIIEKNITGEVFNAVSDGHPTRKDYYTKAAKALGLEQPTFKENNQGTGQDYKVVSNTKLKEQLDYTFIHPFPSEV